MKRLILLCTLFIFYGVSAFTQASSQKKDFYDNGFRLPYQIFKPADMSKKQPLFIFLHGIDERGADNEKQITKGVSDFLLKFTNDYSAIVVAPQCPDIPEESSWSNAIRRDLSGKYQFIMNDSLAATPTLPLSAVMNLVRYLSANENVDTSRIYIGGLSMGAFGTYELLWRMPSKTFAGALIFSGGTDTAPEKVQTYAKDTKIWIFHGSSDGIVPVSYPRDAYNKIQQITGSNIRYTEYPNVDHVCWDRAFNNQELIPWLLGYSNFEMGYYIISSSSGNAVLTKASNRLYPSESSASGESQNWLLSKATGSSYKIQSNDGSNLYLSVSNNQLTLSSTANSQNQYWKIVETEKGIYNIISEANNNRLELSGDGFILTNNTTNPNNQWKVTQSKLYIVGGATPRMWDLNKAQEMAFNPGTNPTFSWTGFLWDSDFKFQSTKFSWETTYNATSANKSVASGESQKLVVQPMSQYDYKFKMTTPGYYKVSVNMSDRSMAVTPSSIANLYLVGSAAPCGWNNSSPEVMAPVAGETGIFIWTGLMYSGEFKFLLNKDSWSPSVNAGSAQNIVLNSPSQLHITNGASGDYKFRVAKEMYYTVTVDTKNWTMTVKEKTTGIPLYLVGSATTIGWNNQTALSLQQLSDSTYTWTGSLKPGEIKFITKLGTWNSIIPNRTAHEAIVPGYTHELSNTFRGDYKFHILDAGSYTIRVNLANYTMVVDRLPENNSIYIVGSATPVGWNNVSTPEMKQDANGICKWEGILTPGEFKFLTKIRTWDSLLPEGTKHETIVSGKTYTLSNYFRGDYKFQITEKGYYYVVVNLKNKTMTVSKSGLRASTATPSVSVDQQTFVVKPGNDFIEVIVNNPGKIDRARLLSINGQVLESVENKDGSVYLGNQLPNGIYLVEITSGGKVFSQKVILR